MLNTPVLIQQSRYSAQSLFQWRKTFVSGNHTASFTLRLKPDCGRTRKNISVSFVPGNNIKAKATSATDNSIGVKAVVTSPTEWLILELVSCELDPNTGLEKPTIKMNVKGSSANETDFSVPRDFGKIGAVLVQNEHNMEMYVEKIELVGFPNGPVHITCNSYVQPKSCNPGKRIFFNKVFVVLAITNTDWVEESKTKKSSKTYVVMAKGSARAVIGSMITMCTTVSAIMTVMLNLLDLYLVERSIYTQDIAEP